MCKGKNKKDHKLVKEGVSEDKSHGDFSRTELVRDHCHLTGKYRGAACNNCNLLATKKSQSFIPIFLHNGSGYDFQLFFEKLFIAATEKGIKCEPLCETDEKYISIQVGCIRFLDRFSILS